MNVEFLLGMFLGAVAALSLNIGKGIQKQKVHVFLAGRRILDRENRRDLAIWFMGWGMTAFASLPYSLGLKFSQSPSIISSLTGIGLVGLVIYAILVIGERINRVDILGVILVIIGTSWLGYRSASNSLSKAPFTFGLLAATFGVMIAIAGLLCIVALFYQRIHGIAFGTLAGMILGWSIFLGDVALVRAGGSFFGQFSNPYPYIALGIGMIALVTTQLGFLRGRALEVVPAINSFMILTPVILEYAIYGIIPRTLNVIIILIIVTGVVLLSTGTAGRVSDKKQAAM